MLIKQEKDNLTFKMRIILIIIIFIEYLLYIRQHTKHLHRLFNSQNNWRGKQYYYLNFTDEEAESEKG